MNGPSERAYSTMKKYQYMFHKSVHSRENTMVLSWSFVVLGVMLSSRRMRFHIAFVRLPFVFYEGSMRWSLGFPGAFIISHGTLMALVRSWDLHGSFVAPSWCIHGAFVEVHAF